MGQLDRGILLGGSLDEGGRMVVVVAVWIVLEQHHVEGDIFVGLKACLLKKGGCTRC